MMPELPNGLNGDLNEGSGGKFIFFELYRLSNNLNLPGSSSLPAATAYNFDPYPGPGYEPAEICHVIFGCTNVGLCWHAQQLVTFADNKNLYTFFTTS